MHSVVKLFPELFTDTKYLQWQRRYGSLDIISKMINNQITNNISQIHSIVGIAYKITVKPIT